MPDPIVSADAGVSPPGEPPPFTVREATVGDAPVLAALRSALFLELGQGSPPEGPATFERLAAEAFATGLQRAQCQAWLAETGLGPSIGSAALLIFPRLPTPEVRGQTEGYLVSVYTVPAWRHRGVASTLVATAVTKARELGLARIRLHTTPEGRRVYAAMGFGLRDNAMELRL